MARLDEGGVEIVLVRPEWIRSHAVTPNTPCPSCDRDLSYPGQPGHECYTYAERAANIARSEARDDAD